MLLSGKIVIIYRKGTRKATGKIGQIELDDGRRVDFSVYDLSPEIRRELKKGIGGLKEEDFLEWDVDFEPKAKRDILDKTLRKREAN